MPLIRIFNELITTEGDIYESLGMSKKVEIMKFKEKIIVRKLFVFLRTTQLQETFWSD